MVGYHWKAAWRECCICLLLAMPRLSCPPLPCSVPLLCPANAVPRLCQPCTLPLHFQGVLLCNACANHTRAPLQHPPTWQNTLSQCSDWDPVWFVNLAVCTLTSKPCLVINVMPRLCHPVKAIICATHSLYSPTMPLGSIPLWYTGGFYMSITEEY